MFTAKDSDHPSSARPISKDGAAVLILLFVAALVLLTYPLFLYRLADRDLWASHEGRAAQDAQTILDDGCWGLPRLFDRHVELQKPPLYYWLVALLARFRGASVDALAV